MSKKKKKILIKRIGFLEFRKLDLKNTQFCLNMHNTRSGIKAANHSVNILGKPVGFLCQECVKEWIEIYESLYKDKS